MSRAGIDITIRYGDFGHESKTIAVPVDDYLLRKLMGRVELSDEPLSLLLASPGMYGGKGDAVTIRKRAFEMRRSVAEQIARAAIPAMLKAFGVNDELDGYRVSDMSDGERSFYESRGRLPKAPA